MHDNLWNLAVAAATYKIKALFFLLLIPSLSDYNFPIKLE